MQLDGKTILVTGASRGIGQAMFEQIRRSAGGLDALVLNASGGLERGADAVAAGHSSGHTVYVGGRDYLLP